MHIITGLVVSSLLGIKKKDRKKSESPALLKAPSIISVVHHIPGRIRLRIPSLIGRDDTVARLQETLGRIEPVRRVDISATTGSVLFDYDKNRVSADTLAAAVIRLLGLERELEKDVQPVLVDELRGFERSLNRAVYEKTRGALDLKTALFIVLAAMGIQKMVKQGGMALPAGFTLLWWAGNGLFGQKGGR
ncbi:MAG: heavy-metal-associated domain-containing protein [Candidatus Latescibacterota bacterium]|nr:MAG: heavy-metal-associated domain-containing protein [Candidatus Latescibacterota bacterium]